jgi:hypothetical protein
VASQIDIASILIGVLIGVVSTIVAYEYQRWRERSTRAGERKQEVRGLVRSELTRFTSGWAVFKSTQDMQVNPGLQNYRNELAGIGRAIRNVLSSSQGFLEKELVEEGMKISGDLTKLSLRQFYADGGVSFGEMIKFGDETAKHCEELDRKLR